MYTQSVLYMLHQVVHVEKSDAMTGRRLANVHCLCDVSGRTHRE